MAENINRNQNGANSRYSNNTGDFDTSEAVGTAGGAVAGAVAGSIFGPLGTVAGAIAGGALGNQVGEGADGANEEERATEK